MILERPESVLSGYSLFHLDETPTSSVDADYKDVLFLSASRYPQFPQLVPYRTFDFFNFILSNSDARSIIFLFALCCEIFREW